MSSYLQGSRIQSQVTFFDTDSQTNIDPTTVECTIKNEVGENRYTYLQGTFINRLAEGVYTVAIDTTPASGIWVVQWLAPPGIGQAVSESTFVVTPTQIPV